MTKWSDRFSEHPVHQSLDNLGESLSVKCPTDEPEDLETFERIKQLHGQVRIKLSQAIPELASPNHLGKLNNILESTTAKLLEFIKDPSKRDDLNNAADGILPYLGTFPSVTSVLEIEDFKKSVVDYSRACREAIDRLNDEYKKANEEKRKDIELFVSRMHEIKDDIAKQEAAFEVQKNRIDELINLSQQNFNSEESRRSKESKDALDALEKKYTEFSQKTQGDLERNTNQYKEQFTKLYDDQSSRLKIQVDEFEKTSTEAINRVETANEKIIKGFAGISEKAIEEHNHQSEALLETLQARLDRATDIVGLIAQTGIAGQFQATANWEGRLAMIMRVIGLVCMGGLVYFTFTFLKDIGGETFAWDMAVFRIVTSLVLLVPAFYCTKAAANHFAAEQRNRKIQMELAAIGPYLEGLPPEKNAELRAELAKNYFGRTPVPDEGEFDIEKAAERIITEVVKKQI